MKKLIVPVFVMLMSVASFAAENTKTSNKEVKKEIRTEIVKLLGEAKFDFSNTIETTVEFLINSKGEVVVVSVSSDNPIVSEYVKSKLNYRKITDKRIEGVYKMPLKIIK